MKDSDHKNSLKTGAVKSKKTVIRWKDLTEKHGIINIEALKADLQNIYQAKSYKIKYKKRRELNKKLRKYSLKELKKLAEISVENKETILDVAKAIAPIVYNYPGIKLLVTQLLEITKSINPTKNQAVLNIMEQSKNFCAYDKSLHDITKNLEKLNRQESITVTVTVKNSDGKEVEVEYTKENRENYLKERFDKLIIYTINYYVKLKANSNTHLNEHLENPACHSALNNIFAALIIQPYSEYRAQAIEKIQSFLELGMDLGCIIHEGQPYNILGLIVRHGSREDLQKIFEIAPEKAKAAWYEQDMLTSITKIAETNPPIIDIIKKFSNEMEEGRLIFIKKLIGDSIEFLCSVEKVLDDYCTKKYNEYQNLKKKSEYNPSEHLNYLQKNYPKIIENITFYAKYKKTASTEYDRMAVLLSKVFNEYYNDIRLRDRGFIKVIDKITIFVEAGMDLNFVTYGTPYTSLGLVVRYGSSEDLQKIFKIAPEKAKAAFKSQHEEFSILTTAVKNSLDMVKYIWQQNEKLQLIPLESLLERYYQPANKANIYLEGAAIHIAYKKKLIEIAEFILEKHKAIKCMISTKWLKGDILEKANKINAELEKFKEHTRAVVSEAEMLVDQYNYIIEMMKKQLADSNPAIISTEKSRDLQANEKLTIEDEKEIREAHSFPLKGIKEELQKIMDSRNKNLLNQTMQDKITQITKSIEIELQKLKALENKLVGSETDFTAETDFLAAADSEEKTMMGIGVPFGEEDN